MKVAKIPSVSWTDSRGKKHNVRLEELESGSVAVMVDAYYVLNITPEGRVVRIKFVGPETGLELTEEGQIKRSPKGDEYR